MQTQMYTFSRKKTTKKTRKKRKKKEEEKKETKHRGPRTTHFHRKSNIRSL